jgi:hypothetical protein
MQIIAVAIGASSVLVQIIFPFVAGLSSPKDRAKNLGFVVGSALVGILLSRAVSGFIAASLGWRRVYEIAACLHIALFITLYILLPEYKTETRLSCSRANRILPLRTADRESRPARSVPPNPQILVRRWCGSLNPVCLAEPAQRAGSGTATGREHAPTTSASAASRGFHTHQLRDPRAAARSRHVPRAPAPVQRLSFSSRGRVKTGDRGSACTSRSTPSGKSFKQSYRVRAPTGRLMMFGASAVSTGRGRNLFAAVGTVLACQSFSRWR